MYQSMIFLKNIYKTRFQYIIQGFHSESKDLKRIVKKLSLEEKLIFKIKTEIEVTFSEKNQ